MKRILSKKQKLPVLACLSALVVAGTFSPIVYGGSFVYGEFAPDTRTFPAGYTGSGGTVNLNVCVVPGTPNAVDIEQSIKNNIAHWNKLQATSSNLRNMDIPSSTPQPSFTYDFESIALHEMGHCIGLGHANLGFRPGLVENDNTNYTASTAGADSTYGFNPGADGVIGSADDVRGDDVNVFYFNPVNNNPFSLSKTVDASNYSRDIAALPMGDLFAANPDRGVATLDRYKSPFSESAMQQLTFNDEVQRTLGHDDVATLRYGMSGLDAIEGTADDYTIQLHYQGITAAGCDINMSMNARRTGFAVCFTRRESVGNDIAISGPTDIFFNPNFDWFFTQSPPCTETVPLVAGEWKMISLPCEGGISSPATLGAVFGDDLSGQLNTDWAVFDYTYTEQADGSFSGAYRRLALTDELENGRGYWILTNIAGESVSVVGEYNPQVDYPLFVQPGAGPGAAYGWNLVGMPFRFPVAWADASIIDDKGTLLSLVEADPVVPATGNTACSGAQPGANCSVMREAYRWNAASADYDLLTVSAGTLDRFDGIWVASGKPDVAIRIPMSAAERTTP
jgi:hypothetical protein